MLKREEVIKKLYENGVETRPIVAGNFTRNPVIEYMNYEIFDDLVVADDIHDNGFFLGNNSKDLAKELAIVYRTLEEIANG